MKLAIKITKEILERSMYCGTQYSLVLKSLSCAIAVAVRDIFPYAAVHCKHIQPFGGDFDRFSEKNIMLPYKAKRFIVKFDQLSPEERIKLPEFSFEINIPECVIDKINISDLENHPTLKLIEL